MTIAPKCVKIKVEGKKLQTNINSEFGLEDTAEEHITQQFAKYITSHFDELSSLIPEFHKLKQIAILSSLAEWFRDNLKIPKEMLNLPNMRLKIPKIPDYYAKGQVPRIQRREERIEDNYLITLVVTGGISLITNSSESIFEERLADLMFRDTEILTPFHITHYDYVNDLLEYQGTLENEFIYNETVLSLIQLMQPISCYNETCNEIVEFDTKTIDTAKDTNSVYNEITRYSHSGSIYCYDHHPYKCGRINCSLGKIISSGQAYFETDDKKFHGECMLCITCDKPITSQYKMSKDGFLHLNCKYEEANRKEIIEKIELEDDFLIRRRKRDNETMNKCNQERSAIGDKQIVHEDAKDLDVSLNVEKYQIQNQKSSVNKQEEFVVRKKKPTTDTSQPSIVKTTVSKGKIQNKSSAEESKLKKSEEAKKSKNASLKSMIQNIKPAPNDDFIVRKKSDNQPTSKPTKK